MCGHVNVICQWLSRFRSGGSFLHEKPHLRGETFNGGRRDEAELGVRLYIGAIIPLLVTDDNSEAIVVGFLGWSRSEGGTLDDCAEGTAVDCTEGASDGIAGVGVCAECAGITRL